MSALLAVERRGEVNGLKGRRRSKCVFYNLLPTTCSLLGMCFFLRVLLREDGLFERALEATCAHAHGESNGGDWLGKATQGNAS